MRAGSSLFLLFVLLTNCDVERLVTVSACQFEVDDILMSEKAFRIDIDSVDSLHRVRYWGNSESMSYEFTRNGGRFISQVGDTVQLIQKEKYIYKLNGRMYSIIRYGSGDFGFDSQVEHYWCPGTGILLVRSMTWRDFKLFKYEVDGPDFVTPLQALLLQDLATRRDESDSLATR